MNTINCFLYRLFLAFIGFCWAFSGNAYAITAPYLSSSEIYLDENMPANLHAHQDQQQSDGATSLNYPASCNAHQCGVGYSPGGTGGEVSILSDPSSGTIGSYTSAVHYTSQQVGWQVTLPGTNPFYYVPQRWGLAQTEGYVRSIYKIISSTGDIPSGDPVTVHANIDLSGTFNNYPTSFIKAAVLVNKLDDAYWTHDDQPLTFGFIEDMGIPAWRYSVDNAGGTEVSQSGVLDKQLQMGDLVVLEMLFSSTSILQNAGDGLVSTSADFSSTFHASLSTTTSGASLQIIPIPSALFSFVSGFIGLALFTAATRNRHVARGF